MLDIEKVKDRDGYNRIIIKNHEGQFHILFAGNLDLYFWYLKESNNEKEYHSFIVGMEDYFLYKCFDELYNNVIDERPFRDENYSMEYVCPHEYFYYPLVKNNVIEWHSDDGDYDEAAILFISKYDDYFCVTLKEGKMSDMGYHVTSVRFRNSGSRYDPYNSTFMLFYNRLCKHDFTEDNQITIYEYMNRLNVRKR